MRSSLPMALLAVTVLSHPVAAAQKELKETHRYPAHEGKRLVIDAATLDVSVRAADVPDLELTTELRISGISEERAASWVEQHTPEAADGQDRLTVAVHPGHSGFLGFGLLTARARLGAVVPTSIIPDITTTSGSITLRGDFPRADPLMLRTSTGDTEMTGAARSVDIRSASGSCRLEMVRPLERFFARSSSGDVTLTGGTRHLEVDTSSGNVWINNLSGPASVETSNGKITLRWDRLPDGSTVRVRTASGKVQIVLPAAARPAGTLHTTTGTIRCDLPGTVNEAGDTVTLDGSGSTLDVESASGEIIVSLADR
jgi:DUF4097 and DUF4098 domain-containing protein YvlB